jgi:CRP-like cAMP-binding protein
MVLTSEPMENQLLAALPPAELQRWLPLLELVDLPLGHVLYESGCALSHVYFPTTAIVSLLYVMENGASAEIAVVGFEGVVGISLFMGGNSTPNRAVVQSAGKGYRLKAQALKDEFQRAGPVMHLLLRYTQALITQMSQTAVCNRHHSLDQQLCRWLLLSLDRLKNSELVMTQELIANMLGVRRELDPLRAWSHLGLGPPGSGTPHLRVLCGGQGRVRPALASHLGDLTLRPSVRWRTPPESKRRCMPMASDRRSVYACERSMPPAQVSIGRAWPLHPV